MSNKLKIKFFRKNDLIAPTYQEELKDLLILIDNEFVPSLSSRDGTTQMKFLNTNMENINLYFKNLLSQNIILAEINDNLVGFISFIDNYYNDIPKDNTPCNYITTIGVSPKYRGKYIAQNLYKYMIDEVMQLYSYSNIVTTSVRQIKAQ